MSSDTLPPDASITQARAWLKLRMSTGAQCPCCRQMVRQYRRALGKPMARWLIWLVKAYQMEIVRQRGQIGDPDIWIDIRQAPVRGGDYAKLTHWELCERYAGKRPRAVRGSGLWRPTVKGIRWAKNQISVPSHVFLYRGRILSWSEEQISVEQAIGSKDEYEGLIQPEGD